MRDMASEKLYRVSGVFNSFVWGCAGYLDYNMISSIKYQRVENLLSGSEPLGYKIAAGVLIGTEIAFIPIIALGLSDGLVDIVKGTHHYVGTNLMQRLTRKKEQSDNPL